MLMIVSRLSALPSNYSLILDMQTIALIYEGKITFWNDSAIQALNPSVASSLPTAPIQVVCRTDASATTYAFTKALSQVVPSFASSVGYGRQVNYPASLNPTAMNATSEAAVVTFLATDQTLGYLTGPTSIAQLVKSARMHTINNSNPSPSAHTFLPINFVLLPAVISANSASLVSAATDDQTLAGWNMTVDLLNARSTAVSWPICFYSYFVFATNTSLPQECEVRILPLNK